MKRTQTVLAGLLLVQVLLILLTRSPFTGASTGVEARPLLPELAGATAVQLQIDGVDDSRVTLVHGDQGWVLEEMGRYPVDGSKVDQLLANLEGLEVRRPVVESSRYHESFGVTDETNEGRLRVWDEPTTEPRVDLVLGTSSNYRTLHVRPAGGDEVYEIRGLSAYDIRADAGAWVEKQLVDVPEEQLVGLRVVNEGGAFELALRDGSWQIVEPASSAGVALDEERVASLLEAARSVRIADPVDPADPAVAALNHAATTITVRYLAASTESTGSEPGPPDQIVVRIGGTVGEQAKRYVTRDGFGFAGTIWESSVKALLETTTEELGSSQEDG